MPDQPAHRPTRAEQIARLQHLLQTMHWRKFEAMVPKLVELVIGVRFAAAGSGFQDGGDAGTAGRAGRRIRLEAKRYSSKFNSRDLLGELSQALKRDPALECWIACATRDIPEQLANDLEQVGAAGGVAVMAIAWDDPHAPLLAALCSFDPAITGDYAGSEAEAILIELAPSLATARDHIRRDTEAWHIGFEAVRAASHAELGRMWRSQRTARAQFGQDIAGGDGRSVVTREGPSAALQAWWHGRAALDAPAAVVGQGGVGKTWAAVGWAIDHLDQLPIIVAIPAGAATPAGGASRDGLLQLIGAQLAAISGIRDADHWTARLTRLLTRPAEEGPALCLLLDGINQNEMVPWLRILQLLQDKPFEGRIRTIVTTRPLHFDQDLGQTRALVERGERIDVEIFGDEPGGELDRMLAAAQLSRSELHEDLLAYARIPRLFSLVIQLRDRLTDAGRITTHRLLWAYGRDTEGVRAGRSFSEADWRAWLAEIARRELAGHSTYTLATLGETAARPDLEAAEVSARLSDIVDGDLTIGGPAGTMQLAPAIVAHALGMLLLDRLNTVARVGEISVEQDLAEWLDPIDGFDERAEILRAATSIMAEREAAAAPEVAAAIVTAWLQTQNLPAAHLAEVHRLASTQVLPLLEAVERSDRGAQASARARAIDALRSIEGDPVAYGLIIARLATWMAHIPRDLMPRRSRFEQAERARSERFIARIGTDAAGPITVLGHAIELIDRPRDGLMAATASILDGKPLAGAMDIFSKAALSLAIRGRHGGWDDLKWLCLFNHVDGAETRARIRTLSAEVAARTPEPHVHPELAGRVAALLLWLTGEEDDARAAQALDPGIDRVLNYEEEYLGDPAMSFFRLERRHAAAVLVDQRLPLRRRLQRAADYLTDPSFAIPPAIVAEARAAAAAFDTAALDLSRGRTQEDIDVEELAILLARCAPDALGDLHRSKLAGFAARKPAEASSAASSAAESLLVADDRARGACTALRERAVRDGAALDAYAAICLQFVEVVDQSAHDQIETILAADPAWILTDFVSVLRPPSADDVDRLLAAFADAGEERQAKLFGLLDAAGTRELTPDGWATLERHALAGAGEGRSCLFEILYRSDAARFGSALFDAGWTWSEDSDEVCQHFGSLAIAAAGTTLPFEQLAPRILPAILPHAARERGDAPAETRLAARIIDAIVMNRAIEPPDPGSELSVDTDRRRDYPLSMSITPGPMPSDDDHPFAVLNQSEETREEHSRRAVATAMTRVKQARADGAVLLLASFDPEDMLPIIAQSPETVASWLEGASESSRDFRRRVRLAEGLYLSLCEALLTAVPALGATLWRALRTSMTTRYLGTGRVEELTLMLFRIPDSETAALLRQSLLDLGSANTDERLWEIAIAAMAGGHAQWLSDVCAADAASTTAWRQRRAIVLGGFSTGADLPHDAADLEGFGHSPDHERRALAGLRLVRDASARHWWRQFVEAENADQAFAALTLLRRTADRRSAAWLGVDVRFDRDSDPIAWRKAAHWELNERDFWNEASKREKEAARQFLDKKISRNIAPWYRAGSAT